MSVNRGLSIDVRGEAIVAVAATGGHGGHWQLDALQTVSTGQRPGSALASALAETDRRALLLLPNDRAGTAVTALPRLKAAELKRAVAGWVARETGTKPEETAVSWRSLPVRGGGGRTQDVFMVHARREELRRQAAAALPWGLKLEQALPLCLVLDEFYRLAGPDAGALRSWNLVFVGGSTNFLCVSTAESLLLVRPLPGDLSQGERPDEYLDRLATEVERSVFFARQTEASPEIERLVVCGDPTLAGGLVARLDRDSSIPAVHWSLPDHFTYERPLPPDLMLPAAAAALACGDLRYNLLGDTRRRVLGTRGRRRLLVAGTATGAALLPLLLVGGLVTARVQERYLLDARTHLDEARERADAAATVYARERLLLSREDHILRFTASERDLEGVLKRLAAVTPPEVVYLDLQVLDRGDRVFLHLAGESVAPALADAQRAFMQFQAALDGNPALKSRGEPRRLEIFEKDDKGVERKKVEFGLEYEVVPRTTAKEG